MEGRFSRGIYYVLDNLQDISKEAEFNYWYNFVHIPDIVATGMFQHPTRYEMLEPKPPETFRSTARYLTIWETDRVDLNEVVQAYQEAVQGFRRRGRIWPVARQVWAQAFQSVGPVRKYSGKPVTGIQVVLANSSDPTKEHEFNDWYDNVHLDHAYESGLYHMSYRFEAYNSTQPGEGKFMAIYETDVDDPAAAHAEIMGQWGPMWKNKGEISEYLDRTSSVTFRSIMTHSGQ